MGFKGNKMFIRILLMFVILSFQNVCFGTMFIPIAFEKQVEEASSGVEVYLNSSRVFKNAIGAIMTEYNFDVLESFNFPDEEGENKKLKLVLPGGTLKDVTSVIEGAPSFNLREKSFLLLKKIESNFFLSNFSLGKFKIEESNGKVFYVSDVFPLDLNVGRIEKNKMIELMKSKWKTSFRSAPRAAPIVYGEDSRSKLISSVFKNASKKQATQAIEEKQEIPFFFWSAVVILIFCFSIIFIKLSKNENNHKS
jgi:hypothetical protein